MDLVNVRSIGVLVSEQGTFEISFFDESKMKFKAESAKVMKEWVKMIRGVVRDIRGKARESFVQSSGSVGSRAMLKKKRSKKFSHENYLREGILGMGGFGVVYLVKNERDGRNYAMKTMKKSLVRDGGKIDNVLTELEILTLLDHPFLVKAHHAYQTVDSLYLLMDYINAGDMHDHLVINTNFPENRTRFYCAEILLALEYLHSYQIVYRDLKPENIMLNSDGHIILIDFGISKILESDTASTCGTLLYLPPEVFTEDYSYEIDWWSFGIVLFEFLAGVQPFRGKNTNETVYHIMNSEVQFPENVYFSKESKSLIKKLLIKDPDRRLKEPSGIKAHSFFKTIDWEALYRKEIEPPYIPNLKSIPREFDDIVVSPKFSESLWHGDDSFRSYVFQRENTSSEMTIDLN